MTAPARRQWHAVAADRSSLGVLVWPGDIEPVDKDDVEWVQARLAPDPPLWTVGNAELERRSALLAAIDVELGRLAADDLEPSAWWQWRRRAWTDGVRITRAVAADKLRAIRDSFTMQPVPGEDEQ